jgi:tRNA A-37 threonylcarbamoyl transferase component Bud32
MQPRWVSGSTQCVDDEALFALARGELGEGELANVEAHLRDCADCRAVLAEASRSLDGDVGEAEKRAPTHIGRYQIEELIGAGASGVVYRALDPKLQRTVAIKVLHPDRENAPELSERMLREAQAMARLSAPQVVAVYDAGIEDGAVYLVMEYVHGSTLAAWLRASPHSREEILQVFGEAGRGLFAAHEKGLAHLDFKPENVLVSAAGHARVTDFGLARDAATLPSADGLDVQAIVQLYAPTRGLVGTPAYIAPELFMGARATPGSDQFAFCVALFAALFERHPFAAGEGITLAQLIDRASTHALLSVQDLGLREARALRLYTVLARGLSADPAERYPDMGELLLALSRAASGRVRRNLIAAAVATLALLGIVLSVRLGRPDERAAPERARATIPAPQLEPTRTAEITNVPAPSVAPAAPAAPAKTSTAANQKHRPKRKSGDVRYKDWLKDPF